MRSQPWPMIVGHSLVAGLMAVGFSRATDMPLAVPFGVLVVVAVIMVTALPRVMGVVAAALNGVLLEVFYAGTASMTAASVNGAVARVAALGIIAAVAGSLWARRSRQPTGQGVR
ncbi:hypothetical protein [Actinopolymorpha alba]|uniref:hypothetical protein n=1 Tax=Actinopolymorpha alba TaxID=533267 RepID=UPI001ED99DC8|nr:hypothetical protein [Actinopolymorpha alba]